MEPYKSKSGKKSGVQAYETGDDYIRIKFWSKIKPYKYSYASAGRDAVEKMKELAISNKGLSTYISRNKPPYA